MDSSSAASFIIVWSVSFRRRQTNLLLSDRLLERLDERRELLVVEFEHADRLADGVEVGEARLEPRVQLGRQLVVEGVERRAMSSAERARVPPIWMSAPCRTTS